MSDKTIAVKQVRMVQYAADQSIRGLFEDAAAKMPELVATHASVGVDGISRLDEAGAALVMEGVNRVLDGLYGVRRGSRSAVMENVAFHANVAGQAALTEAVAEMFGQAGPELSAEMERQHDREQGQPDT